MQEFDSAAIATPSPRPAPSPPTPHSQPPDSSLRRQHQLAGWREWIALPELGIDGIKAKLDTGARTSALHAVRLVTFDKDGAEWVRFTIHPRQRSTRNSLRVELPVLEWRRITSSNGVRQKRPVIQTTMSFFGQTWPIELTLTNRKNMGFRMLLGREALRQRLVVDSSRSYIGGRPTREARAGRKTESGSKSETRSKSRLRSKTRSSRSRPKPEASGKVKSGSERPPPERP